MFEDQKKKYIKDLKIGDKIGWFYKILNMSKRVKRDGEPFLSLVLMDKTGKLPAKIWDNAESCFKMIQEGEIYKIDGYVNEYKNKKEIKIDHIRSISSSDRDFDQSDFIEQASFDTETLFIEMIGALKSNIKNRLI